MADIVVRLRLPTGQQRLQLPATGTWGDLLDRVSKLLAEGGTRSLGSPVICQGLPPRVVSQAREVLLADVPNLNEVLTVRPPTTSVAVPSAARPAALASASMDQPQPSPKSGNNKRKQSVPKKRAVETDSGSQAGASAAHASAVGSSSAPATTGLHVPVRGATLTAMASANDLDEDVEDDSEAARAYDKAQRKRRRLEDQAAKEAFPETVAVRVRMLEPHDLSKQLRGTNKSTATSNTGIKGKVQQGSDREMRLRSAVDGTCQFAEMPPHKLIVRYPGLRHELQDVVLNLTSDQVDKTLFHFIKDGSTRRVRQPSAESVLHLAAERCPHILWSLCFLHINQDIKEKLDERLERAVEAVKAAQH